MTAAQQSSTKQDILHYLLRQGEASAQSIAEEFKLSQQAIRRHLKDLETEGLIAHRAIQAGMGRPNHVYELSSKGRDRLRRTDERVSDRYDEFALSLLDTIAETVGQDQVRTILRKQWERKAIEYQQQIGGGSLEMRVAKLVALRKTEGYMAEYHAIEPTDTQFIITEYNCAISHIAESFPSVCGHELEMFEIALQPCKVQRTHWLASGEHRCGYLIQAK